MAVAARSDKLAARLLPQNASRMFKSNTWATRQLDVKLASGTRVGVGRKRDAQHLARRVDREAAEREGVLTAVERGLAKRVAESVRVRGDEGIPDVDAGLAVRSARGGRLGPGRADLSDLAVIVRNRRVALEL